MSKPQWVLDIEQDEGEDIHEIIKREMEFGVSIPNIAASLGVSYWRLRYFLGLVGERKPRPKVERSYKYPFFKVASARKEWEQRKTIGQLADKYEVPYSTMCSWLYYVSRADR